jgi:hypothetical protein
VSGTNLKTVNGITLLGSGDITIGGSTTWGSITGTLSSQTDLQTALNGKEAAGSYAAASHTHVESDATGLVADLAGKAALSHTHAQSDVTGLATALGLKVAYTDTATMFPLISGRLLPERHIRPSRPTP